METFQIGRTIKRAFDLAIKTIPSAGLLILVVQIISAIFTFLKQREFPFPASANAPGDPSAALAIFGSGWYWATVAIHLALSSLSSAGSIYGMLKAADHSEVTFSECFKVGIDKLFPVLGLTILWYLGVVLGSALFVVPGLILITMWSAAIPALISENLDVGASFGKSRALTQGSRLKIFITLLIIFGLGGVLLFAGLMAATGSTFTGVAKALQAQPLYQLVSIPLGWAYGTLTIAILVSIYLETTLVKEGGANGQLIEVFG